MTDELDRLKADNLALRGLLTIARTYVAECAKTTGVAWHLSELELVDHALASPSPGAELLERLEDLRVTYGEACHDFAVLAKERDDILAKVERLRAAENLRDEWQKRYEGIAIAHANTVRLMENGELVWESGHRKQLHKYREQMEIAEQNAADLHKAATDEAQARLAAEAEVERLREAFRHPHVASESDACAQCGLDLRNPVHVVRIWRERGVW